MTDGRCPSCGGNTNDRSGTDPHKVLLGLRIGQPLPAVCHACGLPTRHTLCLKAVSEPQDTILAPGVGGWIIGLFKPLAVLNRLDRESKTVELSLSVPTCQQCSATIKEPVPHYIDFEERRVDLIVHLDFKRALENPALA